MSDFWLGFFGALAAAGAVGGIGIAVALLGRAELLSRRTRGPAGGVR